MSKKPTYDELVQRVRELEEAESSRKKAEQKLLELEAYQRALLDAVPDTLFLMKPDGTILLANEGLYNNFKIPARDSKQKRAYELVHETVAQRRKAAVDQVFHSGEHSIFNDTRMGKDIENHFHPIKNSQGEVTHVAIFARDITEQRLVKEELRESEQKYRQLFESMMDAYASIDMQGNITDTNASFNEMLGYTPKKIRRHNIKDLTPEKWRQADINVVNKVLADGYSDIYEKEYIRKNGEILPVELRTFLLRDKKNKPVGMWSIVRDITERKMLEKERENLMRQLVHMQKMESIGILAGGIAHDFNNLLAPIMIHTELAMADLPEDSPLHLSMKEIYHASERARDLVKQILAFARKNDKEITALKISPLVKEVVKFLRSTLPTTIGIKYDIKTEKDTILADPTQINQIIMNLCTNAAYAMKEKGNLLEIILDNEDLPGSKANNRSINIKQGRYVRLSVRDNGTGISPSVLNLIFEPYFTTKEVGEGTGLGLATVHGIVKNHGGDITVESKVGQGTTFNVYLPLTYEESVCADDRQVEPETGTERILLVDDEKIIIGITKKMLKRLGYKVTARTSSKEAFEVFRSKPDKFDLIITDMTMPKMTGEALAKKIMAVNPEIPVILCTGFSDKIDETKAKESGISSFIMKPIIMYEMAKTIREVLDRKKL